MAADEEGKQALQELRQSAENIELMLEQIVEINSLKAKQLFAAYESLTRERFTPEQAMQIIVAREGGML